MPITIDEMTHLIRVALPDAHLEITDLVGDHDHFRAVVTSAQFAGKSRVAQHQMVYAALKGRMTGPGALHALALETKTP